MVLFHENPKDDFSFNSISAAKVNGIMPALNSIGSLNVKSLLQLRQRLIGSIR
jgi:hypothetical protein